MTDGPRIVVWEGVREAVGYSKTSVGVEYQSFWSWVIF